MLPSRAVRDMPHAELQGSFIRFLATSLQPFRTPICDTGAQQHGHPRLPIQALVGDEDGTALMKVAAWIVLAGTIAYGGGSRSSTAQSVQTLGVPLCLGWINARRAPIAAPLLSRGQVMPATHARRPTRRIVLLAGRTGGFDG